MPMLCPCAQRQGYATACCAYRPTFIHCCQRECLPTDIHSCCQNALLSKKGNFSLLLPGPVSYTWVARSRSESTSQFTASALNKLSSSSSSSSSYTFLLLLLLIELLRPSSRTLVWTLCSLFLINLLSSQPPSCCPPRPSGRYWELKSRHYIREERHRHQRQRQRQYKGETQRHRQYKGETQRQRDTDSTKERGLGGTVGD